MQIARIAPTRFGGQIYPHPKKGEVLYYGLILGLRQQSSQIFLQSRSKAAQ